MERRPLGKTEEVPGFGLGFDGGPGSLKCDVGTEVKPWFCQLPDALQDALANHLGKLLAEVRNQWRKWVQINNSLSLLNFPVYQKKC